MISKNWKYYFERYFELFRIKLNEDKSITIQNLFKRIDSISKDGSVVYTEWKDLYHIQDLKALKSLSTFLSMQGVDFSNQLFIE